MRRWTGRHWLTLRSICGRDGRTDVHALFVHRLTHSHDVIPSIDLTCDADCSDADGDATTVRLTDALGVAYSWTHARPLVSQCCRHLFYPMGCSEVDEMFELFSGQGYGVGSPRSLPCEGDSD